MLLAPVTLFRAFTAGVLAIVALLISPWLRVRVGVLPVDEIGPLTRNPHHYLWKQPTASAARTWDLWVFKPGTFVCNEFVLQKWRKEIRISSTWIAWWVMRILDQIGGDAFSIPLDRHWSNFPSRKFDFRLGLTRAEEMIYEEWLAGLNIADPNRIVTLCVRDPAYKARFRVEPLPLDLSESYRNHRISDFDLAARELVNLGYTVVRMGVAVSEPFLPGTFGVVDYASSGQRNEMVDIALVSRSQLCVSTVLGIDQVAAMSGKPRCLVNHLPYNHAHLFYAWDYLIPQRIHDDNSGRELTFIESLGFSSIASLEGLKELPGERLANIRNSPEDIRDAAIEALEHHLTPQTLRGDDLRRQQRFWEILERHGGVPLAPLELRPRIGVGFLRKYEWWLE